MLKRPDKLLAERCSTLKDGVLFRMADRKHVCAITTIGKKFVGWSGVGWGGRGPVSNLARTKKVVRTETRKFYFRPSEGNWRFGQAETLKGMLSSEGWKSRKRKRKESTMLNQDDGGSDIELWGREEGREGGRFRRYPVWCRRREVLKNERRCVVSDG